MARLISFGPLQRVPSSWLNKIQDYLFGQRANGPTNQMSSSLNTTLASFSQALIQFTAPISSVGSFTLMDNQIDWRDRNIKIRWRFDDVNDIRPGGSGDTRYALEQGDATIYTSAGGTWTMSSFSWSMQVDGTGKINFTKSSGYLYVEIDSGTQLKERS